MRRSFFAALVAAAVCSGTALAQEPQDGAVQDLRISNVRAFDAGSGTFSTPTEILVRAGRIAAVGASRAAGPAAHEIDARGGYALPGLWDSHVHLSFLSLAGPDSVHATLAEFVQSGVMYVRDVGGSLDSMAAMRERVGAGEIVGPEILFSGPMAERPPLEWAHFNEQLPGFTVPIESDAQVDALVSSVAAAGGSYLKVFGKWDVGLFRRLVRLADAANLQVVVDPGAPFFQDVPIDTALAAGVRSIEHAQAAWQSVLPADLKALHDRLAAAAEPEERAAFWNRVVPLGAGAVDGSALRALGDRMIAVDAYFTPTLRVTEARRIAPPPFPSNATDEERARFWAGWADASIEITRGLAERGVKLLIGQDGQDPEATVEEMELLESIGVPAADVLRAATIHPAQWFHRDERGGSLAVGRNADLVVVREDPLRDMTALRDPVLVLQAGAIRRMATGYEPKLPR